MRILLIGAFPFPYPQGSQVFARQQALALASAGARVAIATYGRGEGPVPEPLEWIPSSRHLAPASGRSGPSAARPLADLALVATVVAAQRRQRFDCALAHNAEAALVAAAARRVTGLRHVYVAHTLLARELSAYAAPRHRARLDRLGGSIDRFVTRRADGVVALSHAAECALGPFARGPIERIPPGLDRCDLPSDADRREACARLGLEPGRFFLYAGNLDGYQELDRLDAAARHLAADSPPIVVVTHDASEAERFPSLRVIEAGFETARALGFAATALVLTRTRTGGFPIKLLNYMEAERPIVACAGVAEGLVHDESAILLREDAPPEALADALRGLAADPGHAARLGRAARHHLDTHHRWPDLARRTLQLLQQVGEGGRS